MNPFLLDHYLVLMKLFLSNWKRYILRLITNPLLGRLYPTPLIKESKDTLPLDIHILPTERLENIYSYRLAHVILKTPYTNIVTFIRVMARACNELYMSPRGEAGNRFGYNFELAPTSLRGFFLDEDGRYLKDVTITYSLFITQLTRLQLEIELAEADSDANATRNLNRCKYLCVVAEAIVEVMQT